VIVVPHLEVLGDAEAVARRGAALIADRSRAAIRERDAFAVAVSGGATPWRMFALLAGEDVEWDRVGIWQVDERVAPVGDPHRGLTRLRDSLPDAAATSIHPMPVDADDLEVAAASYAQGLPGVFDLVHLGLGADGHTGSLVPGDPVLDVRDRDVALTAAPYMGRRRMTVTYRVLDRAREILWVVTGAEKAGALAKLFARDRGIPGGRVEAMRQLVVADAAAVPMDPV
jgi:6-phosphogluconolactonase